jgi:hypothetical protein
MSANEKVAHVYDYTTGEYIEDTNLRTYLDAIETDDDIRAVDGEPYGYNGYIFMEEIAQRNRSKK